MKLISALNNRGEGGWTGKFPPQGLSYAWMQVVIIKED
jgi:hypothetical protein